MPSIASIGIHDYLSACKSGIALRTADNKPSGWVYKHLGILIHEVFRNNRFNNIFNDVITELIHIHIRIVLCGYYDGIDPDGTIGFIIFRGHLAFAVGTQIRKQTALTNLGKPL